MWPFKRKIRQRRLEVRKNIPTQRGKHWRRFVKVGGPGGIALAAGLAMAASALVVFPLDRSPYRLGRHEGRIHARVRFDFPSESLTREARGIAKSETPSTYVIADKDMLPDIEKQLKSLPTELKDAVDLETVPATLRERFALTDPTMLQALQQYADDEADAWPAMVDQLVAGLARQVILSPGEYALEAHCPALEVRLIGSGDGDEVLLPDKLGQMASVVNAAAVRRILATVVRPIAPELRPNVQSYLFKLLTAGRPVYKLDWERTAADRAAAVAAVPEEVVPYQPDQVVFEGGRVTAVALPILEAEYKAYRAELKETDPRRGLRVALGRVGTVGLVVTGLSVFIAWRRRRIVRNHWRGLAIVSLLLVMMGLAKLMTDVAGWNPYLIVGPATMGAVIFTIAYNRRFGLAMGTMLAILLALQWRTDLGGLLVLLAPVMLSAMMLGELRTRSKLIEVGALAALMVFAVAGLTQLARGLPAASQSYAAVIVDSGWAAGAVVAVGFVIQGLLPIIERVFRIATSMTLLEWCDANKRLLKRLAIDAPGTYNHSLQLGTLCEAAAEAIGANGLLARVGAYYHDVGKINKPEYFVENQFGAPSKHAKLSPAMSLLIITGHVKDGIEMAKEYGLPPVLREFVASHHGTTLVRYFYHAATEQQKASGDDRVPEEVEFRYAGPKPQSKEAAILMLADGVESSVRAMGEPTSGRIETQAHSVIIDRLMDGQLAECELTLREVHGIEQSLVKSLCGIYHGRIAYPPAETKTPRQSARA